MERRKFIQTLVGLPALATASITMKAAAPDGGRAIWLAKLGDPDLTVFPSAEDEAAFVKMIKDAQVDEWSAAVSGIPFTIDVLEGFGDPRYTWFFHLGHPNLPWIPSQDDVEQFSALLDKAARDPNAVLVYHQGVTAVRVDSAGGRTPYRVTVMEA